jgi:hypothetical protein
MKKRKRSMFLVALAAIGLISFAPPGYAEHKGGNVSLKDALGVDVGDTVPYSSKATCARTCHVSELPAEMQVKYPGGFPGHNYGSGEQHSAHTQGVIAGDNKIYWQSYDVKGYEHGASVGRHSNQGRNESFSNVFRTNFALPFFTSSPGMFGKF